VRSAASTPGWPSEIQKTRQRIGTALDNRLSIALFFAGLAATRGDYQAQSDKASHSCGIGGGGILIATADISWRVRRASKADLKIVG
jgi:hypothetical protein